jgi:murein DD-endopeptidase MepM/ murein hydrolase activator NlpD
MQRRFVRTSIVLLIILITGFLIPEKPLIPVEGATRRDWNSKSFWFEPWGKSGVHKGIDIFAGYAKPVISAVPGVVIYQGQLSIGGNVVAVLGPKWRIHYYAHLAEPTPIPWFVRSGHVIGAVGTSGNAAGKPPHLHYAILSIVPIPWRYSVVTQGWKRIFFLNPSDILARSA